MTTKREMELQQCGCTLLPSFLPSFLPSVCISVYLSTDKTSLRPHELIYLNTHSIKLCTSLTDNDSFHTLRPLLCLGQFKINIHALFMSSSRLMLNVVDTRPSVYITPTIVFSISFFQCFFLTSFFLMFLFNIFFNVSF